MQYTLLGLWIAVIVSVTFLVKLVFDNRQLHKQLNHEATMSENVWKAEKVALQLFNIVHTPDEDSVPDARNLDEWKAELFRLNTMPSNVLRILEKRSLPILPDEDKVYFHSAQRRRIMELADSLRPQPVR